MQKWLRPLILAPLCLVVGCASSTGPFVRPMKVWCPQGAMDPCGNLQVLPESGERDETDRVMYSWIGEFAECKLKHQILRECVEHNNQEADRKNPRR